MNSIKPQEVASRTQIGTLNGKPVWEVALKGGLHIVLSTLEKGIEYLGAGPHRAVARYLARKKKPAILLTALAKSDHIEPQFFVHVVPAWEDVVERMNQSRK